MNNAENQPPPDDTFPEPGYTIYSGPPYSSAGESGTHDSQGRIAFRPQLDSVEGHDAPVAGIAFLPNGEQAVSLDVNWGLIVWDANRGVPIQRYQLDEHLGSTHSAQVSPDGRLLIVNIYSSFDNIKCAAWDLQSEQMRYTIPGKGDFDSGGVTSPGPQPALLIVEGSDLTVWDLESGNLLHTLRGHTRPIRAFAAVPNSTLVLTASEDATVKLWDFSTGMERSTLRHHTSMVFDVAVSVDGRVAASCSTDQTLQVWDIETGRPVHVFENFFGNFLRMQSDGRRVISANEDWITTWDLDQKTRGMSIEIYVRETLDGVEAIPNSSLAFFVLDDWLTNYHYTINFFDMDRRDVIASFRVSNRINHYAVAPSGKMIAIGDFDGKVHFVNCLEP